MLLQGQVPPSTAPLSLQVNAAQSKSSCEQPVTAGDVLPDTGVAPTKSFSSAAQLISRQAAIASPLALMGGCGWGVMGGWGWGVMGGVVITSRPVHWVHMGQTAAGRKTSPNVWPE